MSRTSCAKPWALTIVAPRRTLFLETRTSLQLCCPFCPKHHCRRSHHPLRVKPCVVRMGRIVSCAAGGSGTDAREHAQHLHSNAVLVQHGRAIRRPVVRRVWQRQPALHASIHLPYTLNHRAGSGRQVEASSAEHAGLCPCRALRRMRRISLAMCSVTASKDRYLCACECLLFEPTRRLGAAARGTTRPST